MITGIGKPTTEARRRTNDRRNRESKNLTAETRRRGEGKLTNGSYLGMPVQTNALPGATLVRHNGFIPLNSKDSE